MKPKMRIAVFCMVLIIMVTASSCEMGKMDLFSYCDAPFSAVVEGEVGGMYVRALLQCDFSTHDTKEIYTVMNMSYLAPESMAGITLTLTSDGVLSSRLGNVAVKSPNLAGLMEPYLRLCVEEDYTSVIKTESGYSVHIEDAEKSLFYRFDTEGKLTGLQGELDGKALDLRISMSQKGKEVGES